MKSWFYEWMCRVRDHPVLAGLALLLGLLASIIAIVKVLPISCGSPPPECRNAIEIGEKRERLRKTHRVRELRSLEEGLKIAQLPNGVFGFTTPWELSDTPTQAAGNVTLDRTMGGTGVTEIHKTREGETFVLVYVDESYLLRMQDPKRVHMLDATVFLTPRRSGDQLCAIPLSCLKKWNARRSSEYGYVVDITVR